MKHPPCALRVSCRGKGRLFPDFQSPFPHPPAYRLPFVSCGLRWCSLPLKTLREPGRLRRGLSAAIDSAGAAAERPRTWGLQDAAAF